MSDRPIPQEAINVLQGFLDASGREDIEEMKQFVSKQTIESGSMNTEGGKGMKYELSEATWEGDHVVIPMRATPTDEAPEGAPEMEMQCLMVQEEGEWKFDLVETMNRLFGGDMGEMMDQMADLMKDTMEGLGDAIAGGLESAFGGGSGSDDAEGNDSTGGEDEQGRNLRLT